MKKLGYIGFSGKNCVCEYLVKELNSEFILVIKQTSSSTTSITNMIETIVNKILDTDLIGTNPSEIKIYEFYSPRLKPLAVWQQVMFEEVYTKKTNEGLVNKILKLFRIYSQVEMWNVNKPSWSSVSKPMQDILTKLDGGLI